MQRSFTNSRLDLGIATDLEKSCFQQLLKSLKQDCQQVFVYVRFTDNLHLLNSVFPELTHADLLRANLNETDLKLLCFACNGEKSLQNLTLILTKTDFDVFIKKSPFQNRGVRL